MQVPINVAIKIRLLIRINVSSVAQNLDYAAILNHFLSNDYVSVARVLHVLGQKKNYDV